MLRIAEAWGRCRAPYAWGGGHGPRPAAVGTPVDCSGYVSAILGLRPQVSGWFARSYGTPGRGWVVTVWAMDGHVLLQIEDRWFGTSRAHPEGGAGEIVRPGDVYLSQFAPRTSRHAGTPTC